MKKDIQKDSVQTYVQLFLDEVELNICVKDDLTYYRKHEPLYNFGFFQITNGNIEEKPIFWDGIEWTFEVGKKQFKADFKKELEKKGLIGNRPIRK
jgi:hypothetical protein